MKKNSELMIKSMYVVTILILYYIAIKKDLYLYVLSLALYNIFSSCLKTLSIKDYLANVKSSKTKESIFKTTALSLAIVVFTFILLSICFSDLANIILNIDNTLLIFIMMGISVIAKPFLNIYTEYIESITKKHIKDKTIFIYNILENILLLSLALVFFRLLKTPERLAISFLYLSKIISFIGISLILYLISRTNKQVGVFKEEPVNYKSLIKSIYLETWRTNIVETIKYSYYYISIIVVYYVLNTRYFYQTALIDSSITFIYLYLIVIFEYLIYIIGLVNEKIPTTMSIPMRIYQNIKFILPISIIFAITAELITKVVFNNPKYSIYFAMVSFLAIFILIFELTFKNIKSKKIISVSLLCGFITKVILIIPLINSFYRTGYNLIYGDILSTAIGMFVSFLINYIYIRKTTKTNENYFEKMLNILYSNIILAIILVLLEFIIPIKTDSYFKSLGILIIYLMLSIGIIKVKNKIPFLK